jgi:hypothetical protein
MKRIFLTAFFLLLSSCSAPVPEIIAAETPLVMGVTLPPKWTETATPTDASAPTATPESTPTLVPILTPLSSGILARPATAAEVAAENSIWTLTDFTELTVPGVKRYKVKVTADSVWMWDCYFCAREAAFPGFIGALRVRFRVEGQTIPEETLNIFDGKGGEAGWICRTWATMLSGWPADGTVELEIRSAFQQAVFDGENEYPAGEYRQVINITVKP